MILSSSEFSRTLSWEKSTERINELVVESPLLLRKIIRVLSQEEYSPVLAILDDGNNLKYGKEVDIIHNPLRLDFNNKKALATLLKILVKTSLSGDFYLETNKFKSRTIRYLDKIIDSENFSFEVAFDDFSVDAIAKAVNIHVVDDEDDFVELLTDYMSLMSEIASVKLFIFLNLRSFLDENELKHLLENAHNHQFSILLIESQKRPKITQTNRVYIDADLCEM